MAIEFAITPLDPTLDREAFSSGVPILDRYFVELVTQDVRPDFYSAGAQLLEITSKIRIPELL
ncbi:MAG: hypothetical protein ACJ8AW_45295 [Rhodopila sp.]